MNKTLARLLYSATALTFIGMAQPAMALPPYPGQPSASSSYQTEVQADFCNSPGLNGWTNPGSPPPPSMQGIGSGVSISYYSNPNTLSAYYYVDECEIPTDLASCNKAVSDAENNEQPITNWYKNNKYNGVTTWVVPGFGTYCMERFGSPPGTGGTGGGWTIVNRDTTHLDLMTPNNTVYKEDSYTNPATCQAAEADLNNVCQNTKGCEPVQNKSACPMG